MTIYFVTAAPGHYGDRSLVYSSHERLADARRAAGNDGHATVRYGRKQKGDVWLRSYEEIYPPMPARCVSEVRS